MRTQFLGLRADGRDNLKNPIFKEGEAWLERGARAERDGSFIAARENYEKAAAAYGKAIDDYSKGGGFQIK